MPIILPFLTVLLLFRGCDAEPAAPVTDVRYRLGEAFTLTVGTTATFKDEPLQLRFINVPADSRCPEGVVCVWAGDAAVRIQFTESVDTLHTMHIPSEVTRGAYTVRMLQLDPYPKHGVPRDTSAYAARFVVTKQ